MCHVCYCAKCLCCYMGYFDKPGWFGCSTQSIWQYWVCACAWCCTVTCRQTPSHEIHKARCWHCNMHNLTFMFMWKHPGNECFMLLSYMSNTHAVHALAFQNQHLPCECVCLAFCSKAIKTSTWTTKSHHKLWLLYNKAWHLTSTHVLIMICLAHACVHNTPLQKEAYRKTCLCHHTWQSGRVPNYCIESCNIRPKHCVYDAVWL